MADVPESRDDTMANAVIRGSADAIGAVDIEQLTTVWDPAARRMFGWPAGEVYHRNPPIVPDELQAEHNAALERTREGGQISKVTRRIHRDGRLIDVRIDT